MARIKTSEGVEVVTRTGPDGRERITSFHADLYKQLEGATATQLRVLAEESRELILDKLYNGTSRPPGRRRVPRPERMRRPEIPTSERRPYRHKALAESTVQDKARAELDGRRLIATGEYTYGIEVFRGKRAGSVYYIVRPKPGQHSRAGVTHRVLAAFHEFGTSQIPARPHWRPVLRVVRDELRNRRDEVRAVALRTAIRGRR